MAARCGSALLAHAGASSSGIGPKVAARCGKKPLLNWSSGPAFAVPASCAQRECTIRAPPPVLVSFQLRTVASRTLRNQEGLKEEFNLSRRTYILGGASIVALAGPLVGSHKTMASAATSGESKGCVQYLCSNCYCNISRILDIVAGECQLCFVAQARFTNNSSGKTLFPYFQSPYNLKLPQRSEPQRQPTQLKAVHSIDLHGCPLLSQCGKCYILPPMSSDQKDFSQLGQHFNSELSTLAT